MDIIIVPLLNVMIKGIDLYQFLLLVYVIFSWLDSFGVLNPHNRFIYSVNGFLFRLLDPALGRLRAVIPYLGGIDLSPLALLFLLYFIKSILMKIIFKIEL